MTTPIITKRIYLHPLGYLNPREITDRIFLTEKTDDEGQTFETSPYQINYLYIDTICLFGLSKG